MKENKFSVLMSLYYKERPGNLNSCLESLVSQTLSAHELILVLDGPIPDDLKQVIEQYVPYLNIVIVPIDINVGLGRALNHGLKYCSHDIVARMDTDDICKPNRFELQMLEFNKDPSLVMVGSSIIEFDESGNERTKSLPLDFDKIKIFCEKKNPFNHMTVMFKKDEVINSGGYIHHFYMEDYNLWLRLISMNKKVKNIEPVLVKARVDSSTMMKRRGFNYIKSECQLFKLKRNLNIIRGYKGLLIFIMRVIPRVLPVFLLKILYSIDRN